MAVVIPLDHCAVLCVMFMGFAVVMHVSRFAFYALLPIVAKPTLLFTTAPTTNNPRVSYCMQSAKTPPIPRTALEPMAALQGTTPILACDPRSGNAAHTTGYLPGHTPRPRPASRPLSGRNSLGDMTGTIIRHQIRRARGSSRDGSGRSPRDCSTHTRANSTRTLQYLTSSVHSTVKLQGHGAGRKS